MRLIKASYEILYMNSEPLKLIEFAGRTCYKSEEKITPESAQKFVQKLNDLKHYSVIEHSMLTIKFIIDRGISHELVRHRLASFSQESTRYCKYNDHLTFIIPSWTGFLEGYYTEPITYKCPGTEWHNALLEIEHRYKNLLSYKLSAQHARSILPNSLKTELVMTANFREWNHIFKLRTSPSAHPQMIEIMKPLKKELSTMYPEIFGGSNDK